MQAGGLKPLEFIKQDESLQPGVLKIKLLYLLSNSNHCYKHTHTHISSLFVCYQNNQQSSADHQWQSYMQCAQVNVRLFHIKTMS